MSPLVRSLVSLAVILASAGATWIAVGVQPPPPPPPSEVESVFSFPADEVTAIAVRTWQGSLRARRAGEHWRVEALELDDARIGSAAAAPPDQERVDEAVGDLVRDVAALPEVSRFVHEGPLAEFGLDAPKVHIDLTLASGQHITLEIGNRTVSGAGLYARIPGSDEVLQIGSLILNEISAALFHLR